VPFKYNLHRYNTVERHEYKSKGKVGTYYHVTLQSKPLTLNPKP
jgi:hypothetical protein